MEWRLNYFAVHWISILGLFGHFHATNGEVLVECGVRLISLEIENFFGELKRLNATEMYIGKDYICHETHLLRGVIKRGHLDTRGQQMALHLMSCVPTINSYGKIDIDFPFRRCGTNVELSGDGVVFSNTISMKTSEGDVKKYADFGCEYGNTSTTDTRKPGKISLMDHTSKDNGSIKNVSICRTPYYCPRGECPVSQTFGDYGVYFESHSIHMTITTKSRETDHEEEQGVASAIHQLSIVCKSLSFQLDLKYQSVVDGCSLWKTFVGPFSNHDVRTVMTQVNFNIQNDIICLSIDVPPTADCRMFRIIGTVSRCDKTHEKMCDNYSGTRCHNPGSATSEFEYGPLYVFPSDNARGYINFASDVETTRILNESQSNVTYEVSELDLNGKPSALNAKSASDRNILDEGDKFIVAPTVVSTLDQVTTNVFRDNITGVYAGTDSLQTFANPRASGRKMPPSAKFAVPGEISQQVFDELDKVQEINTNQEFSSTEAFGKAPTTRVTSANTSSNENEKWRHANNSTTKDANDDRKRDHVTSPNQSHKKQGNSKPAIEKTLRAEPQPVGRSFKFNRFKPVRTAADRGQKSKNVSQSTQKGRDKPNSTKRKGMKKGKARKGHDVFKIYPKLVLKPDIVTTLAGLPKTRTEFSVSEQTSPTQSRETISPHENLDNPLNKVIFKQPQPKQTVIGSNTLEQDAESRGLHEKSHPKLFLGRYSSFEANKGFIWGAIGALGVFLLCSIGLVAAWIATRHKSTTKQKDEGRL